MIEKLKRKLKKVNDRGSSFVLVVVATTFMCILASALLMGAMMTYKLKFYKLNSLNNFYEVEKALDEMYAGVGAATNDHLYSAYTTTAELVVVYDTKSGTYTNLSNDEANELFKKLFITGFTNDDSFKDLSKLPDVLESFISNVYDSTSNPGGVRLDTTNLKLVYKDSNGKTYTQRFLSNGKVKREKQSGYNADSVQSVTFKNVCVKRNVEITGSTAATSSGEYVQSITTDIVLTEPEYNVSFDLTSAASSELYNYAILADMGVEVGSDDDTKEADVKVKGNIYAASDYYNKDYNADSDTQVSTKYESAPSTKWGTTDSSAYSGIFVNGKKSSLTMNSDVIVCSGSLTAYNGAKISMSGRSSTIAELWTDNIVIGGDKGGSIKASADAYVFDDTELNAESSSLTFAQGRYFGYSYNANDTRSLNYLRQKGYLATGYTLRSHFSDSAVIVNGKDSSLDLQNLDSLYIAGKSYIEFSKVAASSVAEGDKTITVDDKADFAFTGLTDYSTGESLDVKTNQLIFLTQWSVVANSAVTDPDTGITTVQLRFPENFKSDANLVDLYSDFLKDMGSGDYEITAIQQTVSGHDYYYLYIGDEKDSSGVSKAEKFAEKYYDLLANNSDEIANKLYNVKKNENFQVKLVLPSASNINANAAVTDQTTDASGDDVLFYRASTSTTMDVETALDDASTNKTVSNLLGNNGTDANKAAFNSLKTDAAKLAGNSVATKEEKQSNFLSYMYINLKDHLSILNKTEGEGDAAKEVNAWEIAGYTSSADGYTYTYDKNKDTYSYDYSITPLTNYVDYSYVLSHHVSISKKVADSNIIVNTGDLTLSTTDADGVMEGIIITSGNVTFDSSVKSFRGLIITGSKLIIDHDMTIMADASFVANLLQKCSESGDTDLSKVTSSILKNYVASSSKDSFAVTGSSITDISYEDILSFVNWKRNVE
jgi:hypothetical protein